MAVSRTTERALRNLREREGIDLSSDNVQPCHHSVEQLRDQGLDAEIEDISLQFRAELRQRKSAIVIQALVRKWLAFLRYQRHRDELAAIVVALRTKRNFFGAISIQRMIRGMLARIQYRIALHQCVQKKIEAQSTVKKKGKGKAGAAIAAQTTDLFTPREVLLQTNVNFVNGFRSYLLGRYDDAIQLFEAQQKLYKGQEGVTQTMIEISKRKRDGVSGRFVSALSANVGVPAQEAKPTAKKGKK